MMIIISIQTRDNHCFEKKNAARDHQKIRRPPHPQSRVNFSLKFSANSVLFQCMEKRPLTIHSET